MPTWRARTTVDQTVPGAQPPVDLLLPTQAAARTKAVEEKAKPWVTKVSVHLCPHAMGESADQWWDCRRDVRSQYEEI